jgi:putative colanic acid biosynthesis acetyltransferase WcaF
MQVKLSSYDNRWYKPGSGIKKFFWHYTNIFFLKSGIFPFYGLKVFLLRSFGAKIGKGVLIKPYVNIKYPWLLEIGNYVWIGEHVWIDNLAQVKIGDNVCISQGAYLLTGNHNYKKPGFDLMLQNIILEDGVWIGARSVVCPGVTCKTHSILTVGSIASVDMEPYTIYRGNPASGISERIISEPSVNNS